MRKLSTYLTLLLAVAVLANPARVAVAGQLAAIVEAVETGNPGLAEFELLEQERVISLAKDDRVVLGYLASCIRDTLAGPGRVRVGASQSTLAGARLLDRRTIECVSQPSPEFRDTGAAAVRLRSRPNGETADPVPALHRSPLLLLDDPAPLVVLEFLGNPGSSRDPPRVRHELRAAGPVVDTLDHVPPLAVGLWRVTRGALRREMLVPPQAASWPVPPLTRLVRF